jgi:acetyltransferase-like isoleucine patch superfamily enzyme
MNWYEPSNFFNLSPDHFLNEFFSKLTYVWEALDKLPDYIKEHIKPNISGLGGNNRFVSKPVAIFQGQVLLDEIEYDLEGKNNHFHVYRKGRELVGAALLLPGSYLADDAIEIGEGVLVETGAMIKGPSIIGPYTVVRQSAYVRGSVLSCYGSVIGHATEAKNVLLLDGARASHFAYLGDSILGQDVNLGAGTKLANLKMINMPYRYKVNGEVLEVNRRKFGAIMGDGVETGCNSVTNPGTILGPHSKLMPNVTAKANYYEPFSILR